MRVVKEHNERRNEILDTAQGLFNTKGYDASTINDILNEIGIAKGTFYHYFKSKEEVLDAINERIGYVIMERVEAIANDKQLSSEDKLLRMFLSMQISEDVGEELLEGMHKPENALMHQKSLKLMVNLLAPQLAKVVKEGIEKQEFVCDYPEEYMRIFLASALTLLDDGIFEIEKEKQHQIMVALISMIGKMLSLPEQPLLEKAMQYY